MRDLWEGEIERGRKAFLSGNMAGLFDCLCICKVEKMPLPDWAIDALIGHVGDAICEVVDKKSGRNSKWKSQYRQDMIDYARYETVRDCLQHGVAWENVFYAASLILTGTIKGGSESTIESSYKRYVKRSKDNPYRYYVSRFLRIAGLEKDGLIPEEVQQMRRK